MIFEQNDSEKTKLIEQIHNLEYALKVERALEKVRMRVMEMESSGELREVIKILYGEINNFNLGNWGANIMIFEQESRSIEIFLSQMDMPIFDRSFIFPGDHHPVIAKQWMNWQNAEDKVVIHLKGKEKQDYDQYVLTQTDFRHFPQQLKNDILSLKEVYFSFAYFKYGYIVGISNTRQLSEDEFELLSKFASALEITYTRFLDLKKAEAQAREAYIEAALERVRAASMAMHNSNELTEVSTLLFKELFGFCSEIQSSGIVLCDREVPEQWMCSYDLKMLPPIHIPKDLDQPIKNLHKAWESQQEFFVETLNKEASKKHSERMMSLPEIKAIFEQVPPSEIKGAESQTNYAASFKQGYLLAITDFPVDSLSILPRFAKVFEQTYTRFQDLLKAEAQAREAKIQLALERVRARTMAMQRSEELAETASLLFEQLNILGVETWTSGVNIWEKDEASFIGYNFTPEGGITAPYQIPSTEDNFFKTIYDAKNSREKFLVFESKGKSLARTYQYMKTLPVVQDVLFGIEEAGIQLPTSQVNHCVFFQHGFLLFITLEPQTEAQEIFKRFGKEFEQTYTRFLDLQKAEVQTREAQIEVGLERVRAASMAMHDSTHLNEVVTVLKEQLGDLGISSQAVSIVLCHQSENELEYWMTDERKANHICSYKIIGKKNHIIRDIWANWKKQETKTYFLKGDKKEKYDTYLLKETGFVDLPESTKDFILNEDEVWFTCAFMKFGFLESADTIKLTEEKIGVLERFAKVFEQTYIRFLDLQKAEAQAREAQIEAALERVRSVSMGMHHSKDLVNVATIVYKEVLSLGFDQVVSGGFLLPIEEEGVQKCWFSETSSDLLEAFNLPYSGDSILDERIKCWKRGIPFLKQSLSPSILKKHMDFIFPENDRDVEVQQAVDAMPTLTVFNMAFFKHGYINLISNEELNLDQQLILIRFASIFEQTYTRFLDLQKAEAQTREAQIEAALERVRSRTMAMHKSSELRDVATVMYDQMQYIGLAKWGCSIIICHKDTKEFEFWLAEETDSDLKENYFVSGVEHAVYRNIWNKWEDHSSPFTLHHIDEYKREFDEYWLFKTDFIRLPDEIKSLVLDSREVFLHYATMRFGLLNTATYESISDELLNTLDRFAKVFEQTYTRFLDLKKAEEQAREAQIEVSLERVRSRAMAMNKSDELVDVAILLRKEMGLLGVEELETSSIYIHNDKTMETECWFSIQDREEEEKLISDHMTIDLEDTWVGREMLAFYNSKNLQTSIIMQGDHRKEWITYCAEKSELFSVEGFYGEVIPERTYHLYKFNNGYMGAAAPSKISDESWDLLKRATTVFSLAYTRFSDLQKAEAQARDAQIEAAMERIRAASMAMHRTEELSEVISVLFKQFDVLGINPAFAHLTLFDEADDFFTIRLTDTSGERVMAEQSISINHHPAWIEAYKSWKNGKENTINIIQYKQEELKFVFELMQDLINAMPEKSKLREENYPEGLWTVQGHCKFGYLGMNIVRPPNEADKEIVGRFAKEFGRLYQRFLDLKKAEAQVRESEIQLALERVRARSMAMHDSSEMLEVADVLFQQIRGLGGNLWGCGVLICSLDRDEDEVWFANEKGILPPIMLPHTEDPTHKRMYNGWVEKMELYAEYKEGEELKEHYDYMLSVPSVKPLFEDILKSGISFPTWQKWHAAYFSQGYLLIITLDHYEDQGIFTRFARVFDQAYTRFLDLQKAEAQAREAQIEAALEKIRGRSMAMQHSDELLDIIKVVSNEVKKLKVKFDHISFGINNDHEEFHFWTSIAGETAPRELILPFIDNPIHTNLQKAKLNNQSFFKDLISPDDSYKWIKHMLNQMGPKYITPETQSFIKGKTINRSVAILSKIFLIAAKYSDRAFTEEENAILKRIAYAFNQAYTRFLDLKKAEALAREAQIEAAMERIRSRSLAMRSSEEIKDVIIELRRQIDELGQLDLEASVVHLYEKDNPMFESIAAVRPPGESGEIVLANVFFPVDAMKRIEEMMDFYWSDIKEYTLEFDKAMAEEWQEVMLEYAPMIAERRVGFVKNRRVSDNPEFWNFSDFSEGSLLLVTHSPASDDTRAVLRKASQVFDLAYRRFRDLQKAEARAREATRQASLDRIRGEIASMRTTEDLNRITPVIWRELMTLEVPFIRCGVFIVDEETEKVEAYLSTPDGKALGVLNLPFGINSQTINTVKFWKKKQVYTEFWDAQTFVDWTKSMVALGQVNDAASYHGNTEIPEELHLHFIPFQQGMLYVGDKHSLNADKIELVKSLAESFSIAYARYEDFKNLEEAKNKIEVTLDELKAAQSQLIQSEKMASLGELTAGIAHEIQNPLNFVNNFSEVSKEMIQEMREEIQNGDMEEVEDISKDLEQNLEKIHHHGKRAESIVKGMLMHSRSSKGEKIPTDINALCDEFLRLSYHGLRAKDRSFNADFEMDFDVSIPKIEVVPQDIGRVLLNLINNAFQACAEKSLQGLRALEGVVKVTTKNLGDKIQITISDNGPGIPDEIKDKIFQPFFTTKPTGQGTGLGLSLAYDIVKAHGGEIAVETEEGRGTRFNIYFPIV